MSSVAITLCAMVASTVFHVGTAAHLETPEVAFQPRRNVTAASLARIKHLNATFVRRQSISELIAGLTEPMARAHALLLSGESSSQFTRQSASLSNENGISQAVEYVRGKMESYGFEVTLDQYNAQYGPNVISVLRGTEQPTELVILGAHLDDIPATGRAPGANDDGSGSASLLSIAQTISEKKATFKKTLVIEHYTGEEQGLVGSRNLARRRAERGDDVVAQIQQDMTALNLAGDRIGLAFVQSATATDPVLSEYVEKIAREYADNRLEVLHQVISGSSCCSDHQSYKENGFPSVGLIEPRGYTGDPQYHRIGDLVNRADYSTLQIALAAQVALAGAAELAGLN